MSGERPAWVSEPWAARDRSPQFLIALGLISWLLYVALHWLSGGFAYGSPERQRPILLVLALLGGAFALYLAALRSAVRSGRPREILPVIAVFAVAFRLVLLFSEPIQEVDIYRYLWDGRAVAAGVSPYRYSPDQVRAATSDGPLPHDLRALAAMRDSSDTIATILSRVHFGELTTVYPPVSQAVFALAAWTTPAQADVGTHVLAMKGWIVLFDLATLAALVALLRQTGQPVGWSLAYAWCPLVLKEFANSGHLDAIAVFLTMLSLLLASRALAHARGDGGRRSGSRGRFAEMLLAALVLGLAVGGKLYPLVLAPLLVLTALRRWGTLRAGTIAVCCALTAGLVCAPLLTQLAPQTTAKPTGSASAPPPFDAAEADISNVPPQRGLNAFLAQWEMNDFLFLLAIENLKPPADVPPDLQPWFVVTPPPWRQSVATVISSHVDIPAEQTPFVLSRLMMVAVFASVALWWSWRSSRAGDAVEFLRAAFLTLAWFWLLLPTQNPWYWTWALPLIPYARSRAWLALSGLVLLYYLRFWLAYHWPDSPVPFFTYPGPLFFDYVITWIEFGPWLAWLACRWLISRRCREVRPSLGTSIPGETPNSAPVALERGYGS